MLFKNLNLLSYEYDGKMFEHWKGKKAAFSHRKYGRIILDINTHTSAKSKGNAGDRERMWQTDLKMQQRVMLNCILFPNVFFVQKVGIHFVFFQ